MRRPEAKGKKRKQNNTMLCGIFDVKTQQRGRTSCDVDEIIESLDVKPFELPKWRTLFNVLNITSSNVSNFK